jgi:hypothetical protein
MAVAGRQSLHPELGRLAIPESKRLSVTSEAGKNKATDRHR